MPLLFLLLLGRVLQVKYRAGSKKKQDMCIYIYMHIYIYIHITACPFCVRARATS